MIIHSYCTWLYTGMHGLILFYSNAHHFSVSYSFSDFVKNVLVLVLVLVRCEIVFLLVCNFR